MQGQVIGGPVLLLRISEEEYATIQEVFAFVPHMDRAIIGWEQPYIDQLAAHLAEAPFSQRREKQLTLSQGDLSCLCSVLYASVQPPFSEKRDVCECLEKLRDLAEQLFHFVEREWVDPPTIQ
jgi:hypothetical protein